LVDKVDEVDEEDEAILVFEGCENDPRALCFAAVLRWDVPNLKRAAELGDAFAQMWVGRRGSKKERFPWTQRSAAQGERDGFFGLDFASRLM
jgi:hypothetical protein